jgi:hypothetical protein
MSKQIEVLELFRDGGELYRAGEVRVVSEVDAAYYCGAGWARDVSGDIPTGARDTQGVRLDVRTLTQTQPIEEA